MCKADSMAILAPFGARCASISGKSTEAIALFVPSFGYIRDFGDFFIGPTYPIDFSNPSKQKWNLVMQIDDSA
jgi:hypothetical protein